MDLAPHELERLRLQAEALRQASAKMLRVAREAKQTAAQLEDMVATLGEQEEHTDND